MISAVCYSCCCSVRFTSSANREVTPQQPACVTGASVAIRRPEVMTTAQRRCWNLRATRQRPSRGRNVRVGVQLQVYLWCNCGEACQGKYTLRLAMACLQLKEVRSWP